MVRHTSSLDVPGGRLAFSRAGSGSPVLLIQGVGTSGHGWRPQVDALTAAHDCVWFDNRGIGESQPPSPSLSVRQMADDAAALIAAQGWASAHVVGHSMGGLIAQRLALSHRDRVSSLTLLCTFARGRDAGASARMAWIGLRTRVGTRRMRRAAFLEIVAAPQQLAGVDREQMAAGLAPLFGHDLADHPDVEIAQLRAMRGEDVTPELPRLAGLPTLIVAGAFDPIAPPSVSESIARGIPGSKLVVLPDQSHGAPILAQGAINALMLEHLGQRCTS